MPVKYEFYICHSDGTWTDCHFIEVDASYVPDGDLDAMAIEQFLEENRDSGLDIVHIGVNHTEDLEEFSEDD